VVADHRMGPSRTSPAVAVRLVSGAGEVIASIDVPGYRVDT
jgi:hypothetical protein